MTARWTRSAKAALVPAIVCEIAFIGGLLRLLGGQRLDVALVALIVTAGIVQVLLAMRFVAEARRTKVLLASFLVALVVVAGIIALALSDPGAGAILMTAGAVGIVVLMLVSAAIEIATGREL